MTPTEAQVEKAARVIAVRSMLPLGDGARAIAAAILTPILTDLEQEILALVPDEFGRISKGLVLAYILGELP